MCNNLAVRDQALERPAAECAHPLAFDRFDGRFGLQLRRLSCLECRHEWWESAGAVIGSTSALRVVASLVDGPRPTGWSAADTEWRRLEEESLAPKR
jgi:hypothetical protein